MNGSSQKISPDDERDAKVVGRKLAYVAVPALLGLICYAITWHQAVTLFGMGILVCLASLLAGGLVGFLFGIPKSSETPRKTGQQTEASGGVRDEGAGTTTASTGIRRNTNIEEISDWLTKIIVGLGIYELKNIPSVVKRLSRFLATGFEKVPGSGALFIVLVVSFGAAGFLFGYLLTVLFLTRAFVRAAAVTQLTVADQKLKEDASTAHLVAAVVQSGTEQQPKNIKDQVLELCRRYVTERASRPPGGERTRIMEGITREMRKLAVAGYSLLKELSASDSAGERLAATAFLQVQPSLEYVNWLTARLPQEVPFIQYQMALALLAAIRALSGLDKGTLSKGITQCLRAVSKDTDEYRILQQALTELG